MVLPMSYAFRNSFCASWAHWVSRTAVCRYRIRTLSERSSSNTIPHSGSISVMSLFSGLFSSESVPFWNDSIDSKLSLLVTHSWVAELKKRQVIFCVICIRLFYPSSVNVSANNCAARSDDRECPNTLTKSSFVTRHASHEGYFCLKMH